MKTKWLTIRNEIKKPLYIFGITDVAEKAAPYAKSAYSGLVNVKSEDLQQLVEIGKRASKRQDRINKIAQETNSTPEWKQFLFGEDTLTQESAADKWDVAGLGTNLLGGIFTKRKLLGAIPLVGSLFNIYYVFRAVFNASIAFMKILESKKWIKINTVQEATVDNLSKYLDVYKDNPDALLELVVVCRAAYAFWVQLMEAIGNIIDLGKDFLMATPNLASGVAALLGAGTAPATGGSGAAGGVGVAALVMGIDVGISLLIIWASGRAGKYMASGYDGIIRKIDKIAETKLNQSQEKTEDKKQTNVRTHVSAPAKPNSAQNISSNDMATKNESQPNISLVDLKNQNNQQSNISFNDMLNSLS